MIENQASLVQAREQMGKMEEVVVELLRQSDTMHPSQLALLLEGPMDVIEHLRGETARWANNQTTQRGRFDGERFAMARTSRLPSGTR